MRSCPDARERPARRQVRFLDALSEDYKAVRQGKIQNQLPLGLKGFKGLAVFQGLVTLNWREDRFNPPPVGSTDNSNTQFAMLGLWAARRNGIPVEPTFRLMVGRFEKTQRIDGWWPYSIIHYNSSNIRPSSMDHPLPSMICVGLMGFAIGSGLNPMPLKAAPPEKEDSRVLHGLAALYREIGLPTGHMDNPIRLQNMYFLWSVERVAMLYNLPTLGDKEWYRWGVEMLIVNQKVGGDWDGSPRKEVGAPSDYGSPLNTGFALLFLKHSHPMKDLTPKLPFTAKKLNDGIIRLRPIDRHRERSTATPSRYTSPER